MKRAGIRAGRRPVIGAGLATIGLVGPVGAALAGPGTTKLRAIAAAAGITLLAGGMLPAVAAADDHNVKVYVCHATSSETNPYVLIHISESAVNGPGGHFFENGTTQAGHEEDLGPFETEAEAQAVCPGPVVADTTTTSVLGEAYPPAPTTVVLGTGGSSTSTTAVLGTGGSTTPTTAVLGTGGSIPRTGNDGSETWLRLGAGAVMAGGVLMAAASRRRREVETS